MSRVFRICQYLSQVKHCIVKSILRTPPSSRIVWSMARRLLFGTDDRCDISSTTSQRNCDSFSGTIILSAKVIILCCFPSPAQQYTNFCRMNMHARKNRPIFHLYFDKKVYYILLLDGTTCETPEFLSPSACLRLILLLNTSSSTC